MRRYFFALLCTISAFTLFPQSGSSELGETSQQLILIDQEVGRLKEKLTMIEDIELATRELELILENINYSPPDQRLLDSIPSMVNNLDRIVNDAQRVNKIRDIHRVIRFLNRHNEEQFKPAFVKLRDLRKYTGNSAIQPTKAQEYRDLKLQEMRVQIITRYNGEYTPQHNIIPQIVTTDTFGVLDTATTLQNSKRIRALVDSQFISDLENRISSRDFDGLKTIFNSSIAAFKTNMNIEKTQFEGEIEKKQKSYNNLLEKQNQIDNAILDFLKYLMMFILGAFLIPAHYRSKASVRWLFENKVLLRVITVFLIVVVILLLGIAGKLESDVIATLLGAISVYILKDEMQKNQNSKKKKE